MVDCRPVLCVILELLGRYSSCGISFRYGGCVFLSRMWGISLLSNTIRQLIPEGQALCVITFPSSRRYFISCSNSPESDAIHFCYNEIVYHSFFTSAEMCNFILSFLLFIPPILVSNDLLLVDRLKPVRSTPCSFLSSLLYESSSSLPSLRMERGAYAFHGR